MCFQMLFHFDLKKMVPFKDISCSIKGFNWDNFKKWSVLSVFDLMHLWTANELANQEPSTTCLCLSFSLLYVPSLHATHFSAKLNIEIYFRKIIHNALCNQSVIVFIALHFYTMGLPRR